MSGQTAIYSCLGACILLGIILIILLSINISLQQSSSSDEENGSVEQLPCPDDIASKLPQELERVKQGILKKAAKYPSITWSQYDPSIHSHHRVLLHQSDFDSGTLRLTSPGIFQFTEDVIFDPQAQHDYAVIGNKYDEPQYRLGYFAALTIESSNVMIDLAGHNLSSSQLFALQQRFHALIELGGQPFISGQGPASFGTTMPYVNGAIVVNGTLGTSSHHSIHGNGGKNVLLQDLTLVNYEVAGIALNGFSRVVIERIVDAGTRDDIPVIGTYSNARFLQSFTNQLLHNQLLPDHARIDLQQKSRALQQVMDVVVQDVKTFGSVQSQHTEAYNLFANPRGLVDGNTYGILLHGLGVAVGAFLDESSQVSNNILIRDTTITDTKGHIIEVVALVDGQGTGVRGPAGDIIRILDNEQQVKLFDDYGNYKGNVLSKLQVSLQNARNHMNVHNKLGTLNIGNPFIHWTQGITSLDKLITAYNYTYKRNGDTMFHVNKGVIGLRIDSQQGICMKNVAIINTVNEGNRGNCEPLPGETSMAEAAYISGADGGHPAQGRQYGYMGADVRGISIAAASHVHMDNVTVDGVHAKYGYARGLDVFNNASEIHFPGKTCINDVTTLTNVNVLEGNFANGPKVGSAIGIHAAEVSPEQQQRTKDVIISNVRSAAFDLAFDRVMDAEKHINVPKNSGNIYEL